MNDEDTVFTLVTGLSGRLYVSGFLDRLRSEQRALVSEAVSLAKGLREDVRRAVPFWPLGLPDWEAEIVCLGLRTTNGNLLFLWDRGDDVKSVDVPGLSGEVEQLFPRDLTTWKTTATTDGLRVRTGRGRGARVFRIASNRSTKP